MGTDNTNARIYYTGIYKNKNLQAAWGNTFGTHANTQITKSTFNSDYTS